MPWIRLSDNYQDDEKIDGLSDGAFRLWHQGMAYCRRNQTDGLIPFGIMRGFKSFSRGREKELASPFRDGLEPLWVLVPAMGYRVSNYLKYNLSKEEEGNQRSAATARMRKFRAGDALVTVSHTPPSDANVPVTAMERKEGVVKEREFERKPDARSKRPIFSGQRMVVFEWMLDDCIKTLGPHSDEFDLDAWFWDVDALLVKRGQVAPKRDSGEWLQAQLLAECKRRGIPLRVATAADAKPSYEERLAHDTREVAKYLGIDPSKAGIPQ